MVKRGRGSFQILIDPLITRPETLNSRDNYQKGNHVTRNTGHMTTYRKHATAIAEVARPCVAGLAGLICLELFDMVY